MNKIDWPFVLSWLVIIPAVTMIWWGMYKLGEAIVMVVGNAL